MIPMPLLYAIAALMALMTAVYAALPVLARVARGGGRHTAAISLTLLIPVLRRVLPCAAARRATVVPPGGAPREVPAPGIPPSTGAGASPPGVSRRGKQPWATVGFPALGGLPEHGPGDGPADGILVIGVSRVWEYINHERPVMDGPVVPRWYLAYLARLDARAVSA